LLEHGADPDDRTWGSPSSILELVSGWGDVDKMQLLLDHGAQLHDTRALHDAARKGAVAAAALLLDRGVDIERLDTSIPDPPNGTALHHAARAGHFAVVSLLLARGADRSARDARGRTAREIASEHGHGDVAAILADE
jgi:ankyrin repeat protein